MYYDQKHFTSVTAGHAMRMANEAMLTSNTKAVKENVDKINQNMIKLVATKQMIYDSLYEINEAITDGKEVKQIIFLVKDVANEAALLHEEAEGYYHGMIFANKYLQGFINDALTIYNDLTKLVLTKDKKTLMNYNARDEIIKNTTWRLQLMRANLTMARNAIYWGKINGFWKTLNPFADIIAQDKMIINEIIWKAKQI